MLSFITGAAQLQTQRDLEPEHDISPLPQVCMPKVTETKSHDVSIISSIAARANPLLGDSIENYTIYNEKTIVSNSSACQEVVSNQPSIDKTARSCLSVRFISDDRETELMSRIDSAMESMPITKTTRTPIKTKPIDTTVYTTLNEVIRVVEEEEALKNGLPLKKIVPEEDFPKLIILPNIDQGWTLINIVRNYYLDGWHDAFANAIHELIVLSEFLENEEKIFGMFYPLKKNIFTAFELCSLYKTNVVIIGQDPYQHAGPNGMPTAVGLSFSTNRNNKIPGSLLNIYKAIKMAYPNYVIPYHGDISCWARQGVLLLNKALTVRAQSGSVKTASSHINNWSAFLSKIINSICHANRNCIFVLWGRKAQEVKEYITSPTAVIIEGIHPSPNNGRKFIDQNHGHFIQINDELVKQGKSKIDWTVC